MKMTLAIIATACASLACADTNSLSKADRKMMFLRRTGGEIVKPAKGFVAIINQQDQVTSEQISQFFFPDGQCMKIPFRHVPLAGKFNVRSAAGEVRRLNASAAIFLINDPELPMSLVSLEAKWAMANIAPLTADNPKPYQLLARLDKLFSRVTMQVLGAGSFMDFPMSAMKPVVDVASLDALKGMSPAPVAMLYMNSYMKEIGIESETTTLYVTACRQGWAPAPTNEYQKAIWDKIHELPSNPMKIEYDPATKKGKVTK